MQHTKQMSESFEIGIVLAMAGGFMDAYSYMCRGEVFANAQTGNILLLGIGLSEGNFRMARMYFFPVMFFILGIAIATFVRICLKGNYEKIHWRQISVLIEILALICVCFIPLSANLLANSVTSLACGIQVESFRKIRGNGMATTMCIGNLRSATQNICEFCKLRDKKLLYKGMLYYGIILFFVIGAIIGNIAVKHFGYHAIVLSTIILAIAFCMMFVDRQAKENADDEREF